MIPQSNHQYKTQSNEDVTTMYYKTDVFRYYFLFTILEWNKLDMQIRKSKSSLSVKNSLAEISQPKSKPAYNIYNPIVLEFLTELWLGLNHLNEHKIKHNLQDRANLSCLCSLKIESLSHFFLPCHHFTNICETLLDNFQSVNTDIPSSSDNGLVDLLLHWSPKFISNQNNKT